MLAKWCYFEEKKSKQKYPHPFTISTLIQRLTPNNSKSCGPDPSNPSLNLSPLVSFPLYKIKPSPGISKSIFRVLDSLCSPCHRQKTQRTRYPSKPCERETESLIALDSTSDFFVFSCFRFHFLFLLLILYFFFFFQF